MIYLDYNATAPLRPQARERMQEVLARPCNPSSAHGHGRAARRIVEDARVAIAGCIGAFPAEVYFTASGTEANNWALHAFAGRRVLASAVEHSSILKAAPHAETLSVDGQGVLRLDRLEAALAARAEPALVCVMLANNETGVIQPVAEAAEIAHAHGALLHCDAVQAFGKIPVDFGLLKADTLVLSAHKCGGPVGAAILAVRSGLEISPLLTGGGQERSKRAGTENTAAIAGFAAAAELAQDLGPMRTLRSRLDTLEAELAALGAVIYGKGAPRLPNTTCIGMPGVSNEVQLMHFDLSGIAVSAGSACSSGRIEPSHVLAAMGVPAEQAAGAIRISGGWGTKREELEQVARAWKELYQRKHRAA